MSEAPRRSITMAPPRERGYRASFRASVVRPLGDGIYDVFLQPHRVLDDYTA